MKKLNNVMKNVNELRDELSSVFMDAATFIECNFLYNCITQMEMQANVLRPIVKNNIGSGKYALLQKLDHDKKILKQIYDENRVHILKEYEKQMGIEFELLKTPKGG